MPAADDHLTRTVGLRLREAREARGVSLRSLAGSVGVSPGMLSQLENGRSRPSVGTLYALVSELGLSLDAVFPDGATGGAASDAPSPSPGPVVQRAGERQVLELSGEVTWEQLNGPDDPDVVFALVTYRPGEATDELPSARHAGREYGFVLSGRLHIDVDGEQVELGAGDAVSFTSERPHRFRAVGDEPARAVWFNRST